MTSATDQIIRLCQLALAVNALLDDGQVLSTFEVRRHIFDGDVLAWLDARYPNRCLRLALIPSLNQAETAELFQDMATVRTEQRYGVAENGLCLLLAYSIDGLQRLIFR